jgi:anti-sigma factor RsiW
MSSPVHDRSMLGAYALGALDPREAQLVHDHLLTCAECRLEVAELADLRAAMDDVPPEAFLDGPPDGGDLILQRTLRAARSEFPATRFAQSPPRRRNFALRAASVIIAGAVALGGGILIGRETAPESPPQAQVPANARKGQATDPVTQASLDATLIPQAGWVRVHVVVAGIPQGEPCELVLIPRNGGEPVLAGSWLVSENGAKNGTALDGSGLIDPTVVQAVAVRNISGKQFVAVNL